MAQEAELILSFYKTPCQLRLTLWAGTRDLAVPCPQRVYCIYPILPPRHRRSEIPQRATEAGRATPCSRLQVCLLCPVPLNRQPLGRRRCWGMAQIRFRNPLAAPGLTAADSCRGEPTTCLQLQRDKEDRHSAAQEATSPSSSFCMLQQATCGPRHLQTLHQPQRALSADTAGLLKSQKETTQAVQD